MSKSSEYKGRLVILIAGGQGSGKSTTADKLKNVVPDPANWVTIGTDKVRTRKEEFYRSKGQEVPNYSLLNADKLYGDFEAGWEWQAGEILKSTMEDVEDALAQGKDVIIEGTHCTSKVLDELSEKGATVVHIVLTAPTEERQERLGERAKKEKAGRELKDIAVKEQLGDPNSAAYLFTEFTVKTAKNNGYSVFENVDDVIQTAEKIYAEAKRIQALSKLARPSKMQKETNDSILETLRGISGTNVNGQKTKGEIGYELS